MASLSRPAALAVLLLALGPASARACDAPPPPVFDIDANRYYTDPRSSVIDPVLKARNAVMVRRREAVEVSA